MYIYDVQLEKLPNSLLTLAAIKGEYNRAHPSGAEAPNPLSMSSPDINTYTPIPSPPNNCVATIKANVIQLIRS